MKPLTHYIDRDKKFRQFKQEIEDKLAKWMAEHPSDGEVKALPPKPDDKPRRRNASVQPSVFSEAQWVVYADGYIVASFQGDDAWQRATKLCNDILNNPGSDSTQ